MLLFATAHAWCAGCQHRQWGDFIAVLKQLKRCDWLSCFFWTSTNWVRALIRFKQQIDFSKNIIGILLWRMALSLLMSVCFITSVLWNKMYAHIDTYMSLLPSMCAYILFQRTDTRPRWSQIKVTWNFEHERSWRKYNLNKMIRIEQRNL